VNPPDAVFAVHAALREYDELLAHPIDQGELERYRTFLDRYTALEELTPSRRLGYALDDATYGTTPAYLTRMHDAWDRLDPATLAAAARRHLEANDMAIVFVAKAPAALVDSLVSGAPAEPPHYKSPKPPAVTDADAAIERFAIPVRREDIRVVRAVDLFRE
jgi:hypothetical protein